MKRVLLFALVVAGCATTGEPLKPQAELPVSQQTPVGDARTRAKSHAELGMLYFAGGQTGVAMDEGRLAVASDPSYAGGYNLLGLAHMFIGEMRRANESFDQAVHLAPNDPEINNNFGWFLCQDGRPKEGIRRLLVAAGNPLYNTPTRPLFNAGLCSMMLKEYEAAQEYFRRALIADGTNAGAYFQLANIAYGRSSYDEARRFVAEVHRLIEPTAESLWLALRIERKLGDRNAEAGFTGQLRRKFPGSPQHQALLQGRDE